MIRFDERFIHCLEIQDIFSCDDMMRNVPICCQSIRLKKVIWEELYYQGSPVELKAKGLKFSSSIVRTSHAVQIGSHSNSSNSDDFHENVPKIEYAAAERVGKTPSGSNPALKLELPKTSARRTTIQKCASGHQIGSDRSKSSRRSRYSKASGHKTMESRKSSSKSSGEKR